MIWGSRCLSFHECSLEICLKYTYFRNCLRKIDRLYGEIFTLIFGFPIYSHWNNWDNLQSKCKKSNLFKSYGYSNFGCCIPKASKCALWRFQPHYAHMRYTYICKPNIEWHICRSQAIPFTINFQRRFSTISKRDFINLPLWVYDWLIVFILIWWTCISLRANEEIFLLQNKNQKFPQHKSVAY